MVKGFNSFSFSKLKSITFHGIIFIFRYGESLNSHFGLLPIRSNDQDLKSLWEYRLPVMTLLFFLTLNDTFEENAENY